MNKRITINSAVVALGLAAGTAFFISRGTKPIAHAPGPAPAPEEPTLNVSVVPTRKGTLSVEQHLYGTVASLSSTTHSYSLPYEVTLQGVEVTPGQHVEQGDALFSTNQSPNSALATQSASQQLRQATLQLEQVERRDADGLATRDEILRAQGALHSADLAFATMRNSGQAATHHTVTASRAGVVSAVFGKVGQLVAPGTSMVDLVEDESIGVELWADPANVDALAPDLSVVVTDLDPTSKRSSSGHILQIARQVEPTRRLVRVAVAFDDPGMFLLGTPVQASVQTSTPSGFIVPRSSLVSRDGKMLVFTVEQGRAVEHTVTLIADKNDEALVDGELDPHSRVITTGAYQARPKIRVAMQP